MDLIDEALVPACTTPGAVRSSTASCFKSYDFSSSNSPATDVLLFLPRIFIICCPASPKKTAETATRRVLERRGTLWLKLHPSPPSPGVRTFNPLTSSWGPSSWILSWTPAVKRFVWSVLDLQYRWASKPTHEWEPGPGHVQFWSSCRVLHGKPPLCLDPQIWKILTST